MSQRKINYSFYALIIIIILFFISITTINPFDDDSIELARRVQCASNQYQIYRALKCYHDDFEKLPDNLMTLAQAGHLDEGYQYCPSKPRRFPTQKPKPKGIYEYYPDNYGDPNLPLISEPLSNHWGEGLRLNRVEPIINQIMGDGSRNKKMVQIEK